MNILDRARKEMWAKQSLQLEEIDYAVWDNDKTVLRQMAKMSRSSIFVVDVYQCRYAFASSNFAGLLGYDARKLETVGQYDDDYLESRIHPDDLSRMKSIQVDLSRFIYSQPEEKRNDYENIFTYRLLNARRQYIYVTSRHRVLETSVSGKAWLILGVMDIASDQRPIDHVECAVLDMKTGDVFSPDNLVGTGTELTGREIEILQLIQQGLLSKEIAYKLGISIHTVNIHRQNLLRKLGAQNAVEAIRLGRKKRFI